MINKMIQFITKHLNGKKVLFLFLLTNLVYAFMLIITIPKTMQFSNGMKLLDMMPMGYNSEYVNSLFNTLGEKGREVYLLNQIPIDMIYPFLFAISYALLIAFFLKKLNLLNSRFKYLTVLPMVAGITDYLENFGIIYMLNSYPDISNFSIALTNLFTMTKSISTTIYFMLLIIVLAILMFKTVKKQLINQ